MAEAVTYIQGHELLGRAEPFYARTVDDSSGCTELP